MAAEQSLTVVIVSYNHAETLPACLAAVAALVPAPERVVLIDNASADGSAAVARASAANTGLEVVQEERNTGFATAVNRGIRAAETPWVLLLNPDCAPRPEMPAALFNGLDSCPEPARVGALSPRLLRAVGPDLEATATIDAAGMMVTCSGRHFDRGAGRPDGAEFRRPAWVFGGTGAAVLLRREALEDVAYPESEYFAESFFAYREDAELAWRLQLRGWRCLYVPEAVAYHRRGLQPERGRRGHQAINRYSVRNRFLLRAHCADFAWHLRCAPWWLLRDLVVVGACLTVERSSRAGLAEAWRLRAEAAAKRRWVLGRRTVAARRMSRWFRRQGWIEEVETS